MIGYFQTSSVIYFQPIILVYRRGNFVSTIGDVYWFIFYCLIPVNEVSHVKQKKFVWLFLLYSTKNIQAPWFSKIYEFWAIVTLPPIATQKVFGYDAVLSQDCNRQRADAQRVEPMNFSSVKVLLNFIGYWLICVNTCLRKWVNARV